jgi:hypothetical protein
MFRILEQAFKRTGKNPEQHKMSYAKIIVLMSMLCAK